MYCIILGVQPVSLHMDQTCTPEHNLPHIRLLLLLMTIRQRTNIPVLLLYNSHSRTDGVDKPRRGMASSKLRQRRRIYQQFVMVGKKITKHMATHTGVLSIFVSSRTFLNVLKLIGTQSPSKDSQTGQSHSHTDWWWRSPGEPCKIFAYVFTVVVAVCDESGIYMGKVHCPSGMAVLPLPVCCYIHKTMCRTDGVRRIKVKDENINKYQAHALTRRNLEFHI